MLKPCSQDEPKTMEHIDPNSFDKEIEDAQKGANPDAPKPEGTDQKETVTTEQPHVEEVDYRKKFIDSAKGAQQLLKEKQELEAENERLRTEGKTIPVRPDIADELPGFDTLEPDQQDSLVAYTNAVRKKVTEELHKDPAIAFARQNYAESKFNNALDIVVATFPDLLPHKEEFKTMYFNAQNVPDNIQQILENLAKAFLFDKAKDIGAREANEAKDRVELEDTTGGERGQTARRTLADWQTLAQSNPAKFASLRKEYEADLASGQLQE